MLNPLRTPALLLGLPAVLSLFAPAAEPDPLVFKVIPPDEASKGEPVEITIRNADPALSQAIMAAVNETLSGKEKISEAKPSPLTPEALEKQIKAQSERVEKLRKALAVLIERYGIPYFEDSQAPDQPAQGKTRLGQFKTQQSVLKRQIEKLESLKDESLLIYAAGLDVPENRVNFYYTQHRDALSRKQILMAQGLGDKHPDLVSLDMEIAKHLADARSEITSVHSHLKTKLELINWQVDRMEDMLVKESKPAERGALKAFQYREAKREYEEARALLLEMKRQQLGLDR